MQFNIILFFWFQKNKSDQLYTLSKLGKWQSFIHLVPLLNHKSHVKGARLGSLLVTDRPRPLPGRLFDLSSFVETRQVMMNTFQMSCKEKDIALPFCMVRIPLKTSSLSVSYFRTSFISQGKMKNRRNHVSFAVCCRSEMFGYIRVFPATCSLSSKLDGEYSEFEEHLWRQILHNNLMLLFRH